MANKRLFLSIPEDELLKLDVLKNELGMDRSHYIRYLLSGEKKRIPESIKEKKLIEKLSDIDLHLRHICLKEGMDPRDVLYVFEALKDIRKAFDITTKYDITKPGVDGTEITFVLPDGTYVSGYCQDNIIDQHIDDETWRSVNSPNVSSGLKSVALYRITGSNREAIWTNHTRATFGYSNTHSFYDVYYEIQRSERTASYYEIIVTDFAGNITRKKLTSQYSLLTWFHTSIDRSSYGSDW